MLTVRERSYKEAKVGRDEGQEGAGLESEITV